MPPLRVHLDSLGCRLNQAELERIAARLREAGHVLVATPKECDWAVINSCTVTHRADRDARARVRALHRANPDARIAVTGCWSTLEPDTASALPGVVLVVPNDRKEELPSLLGGTPKATPTSTAPRRAIPGPRRRARAFLKVQDGCDHACAYCLTTQARGASRSVAIDTVVADLEAAEKGGIREVVLTGVQLSDWGKDLPSAPTIADLLDTLLASSSGPRIRLSSLEPWGLPEGLFERWANPRLCRQLHLPFQSGCDATLARMRRPYRRAEVEALVHRARARIPRLALTTDVLVGFPGESEGEFAEALAWLDDLELAGAHVFTWSSRPGTPAADMPGRVDPSVAKERRIRVLERVEASKNVYQRQLLGRTETVLWVSARQGEQGSWLLGGLTDHGVRVRALSSRDRWSHTSPVRLTTQQPWGLEGEIVEPSGP